MNLTFSLDDYKYNVQGCTEPSACNYDENVDLEDGSCWYPNEVCECMDGEGAISDECGTCDTDSENDCILGCIDFDACNFNEDATDDDGSCEYPEENYDCDGNCIVELDCADICGGSTDIDECGECGGGGPEPYYDCDGNCLNDEDDNGICDELETGVCDIDGNCYETILIGDQLWMSENLKVTHYNDGSDIQYVQSESSEPDVWENLSTGAYGYYNDDPSHLDTYGNLYNWYAVDDDREICPEGWHVPSDLEIQQLEIHLGMDPDEADDTGWRGTDEGSKLAGNEELWNSGDLENNEVFGTSGFNVLPAGYRNSNNGYYYNMGNNGYFWSSSEYYSYDAWYRVLYYGYSYVYRLNYDKQGGFSIRCLGD